MKINPILMPNFSMNNRINNSQNKALTPNLKSLNHDTFTPSFGEVDGGIFEDYKKYNFKKEYKEIKQLLNDRCDFTPHEKRVIAGTVKYEHSFEQLILAGRKPVSEETKRAFDKQMKGYTDLAKEMISRKRFSAYTITRILRIDRGAENLDVERLLVRNKQFAANRIVPFMTAASEQKCDWDKMKEMLEDGVFSEKRLINETKTV